MDDATLIAAHQTGDPHALSTLMTRHQPSLMGFLRNRVGAEADDLYQETWSKASGSLSIYQEQGNFRAWLFQIARRLIIDHRRRRGARIEMVLGQDEAMLTRPTHATPDQQLAALDVARTLERALKEMSPETAQVVRMRLLEGVPFKEIARRQGVPLNTALGRMHRALKHLRSDLIDAHLIQGSTP